MVIENERSIEELIKSVGEFDVLKNTSPRYLILCALAKNYGRPMYYDQILNSLEKYEIPRVRCLIELCKLAKKGLVTRMKYKLTNKYLYSITKEGLEVLKGEIEGVKNRKIGVSARLVRPYAHILNFLIEPKTLDELCKEFKVKPSSMVVYLSNLYALGAIRKEKRREWIRAEQRTRGGRVIMRKMYVYKTLYVVDESKIKELGIEEKKEAGERYFKVRIKEFPEAYEFLKAHYEKYKIEDGVYRLKSSQIQGLRRRKIGFEIVYK